MYPEDSTLGMLIRYVMVLVRPVINVLDNIMMPTSQSLEMFFLGK